MRLTRREAVARGLQAIAVTGLAGCGDGGRRAAASGSTLTSTWGDPVGDGELRVGPGEQLLERFELGRRARPAGVLATLGHITDAHVLDAASPARVSFLDRLGPPFQSTFRPQEALSAQVMTGAVEAMRAFGPQFVIQGGDLIDNDQSNELTWALSVLRGGGIRAASGGGTYIGVQSAVNPDPFYYRPDLDAPRHPGLLRAAARVFASPGLRAAALPVLGDHDVLVAGEIVPTGLTRALAVGDRALWDLPRGLSLPAGASAAAAQSPDGPPDPGLVDEFLRRALRGPTVAVPPDRARREMDAGEVLGRLRRASGMRASGSVGATGGRLDYVVDAGPQLRLVVMDLVRRAGGSGGLVAAGQPAWLAQQLVAAGRRWVLVITHQPLTTSVGGERLLSQLDRSPRVIAAISGHTHRNRIVARPTAAGGYWLISTASLIDYPQQVRALRLLATVGGGVALQTWMLDHIYPGQLGSTARQLSYIDAQGGRVKGLAGARADRNATLYRSAPA